MSVTSCSCDILTNSLRSAAFDIVSQAFDGWVSLLLFGGLEPAVEPAEEQTLPHYGVLWL